MPLQHDLTILMPCRDQLAEFLVAALQSVCKQTSPRWQLLVLIDPDTPAAVAEHVRACADGRISVLVSTGTGLGGALNTGMRAARTPFACILLSDDLLELTAVSTMERHLRDQPTVDFFYSSRQLIDGTGKRLGAVMQSRPGITTAMFAEQGSQVKHLLCWRVAMGLRLGGIDESLSLVGCDDFDFPWRMAEAGARFAAVPECLYLYRRHDDFPRLTTRTPIPIQLDGLTRMFRKHQVAEPTTSRFLREALESYLVKDATGSHVDGVPPRLALTCHREYTADRRGEFLDRGYRARHFFPHRTYTIPKGGPDGLRLAHRMCGVSDPSRLFEILLFAVSPQVDLLPAALFFDDEILWHQQQLGLPGQVASANVVLDGDRMFGMAYVSDLVQRISRRRSLKTRVEKLFAGWSRLLIHSVLVFALEHGVRTLHSPTAELARRHTDPSRHPMENMFRRIYDEHLTAVMDARRVGDWWQIDVPSQRGRAVFPEVRRELGPRDRIISICHDIEHAIGHPGTPEELARAMTAEARRSLVAMLEIERAAGIRCTYNVVGQLFDEVAGPIGQGGHALGFHSYDHEIPPIVRPPGRLRRLGSRLIRLLRPGRPKPVQPRFESRQLELCRERDYRIKGYRPSQSVIGTGVSDANLSFHNFEWLASSCSSLRRTNPGLENGIVKIPIHMDDFSLHTGEETFDTWAARLLEHVDASEFTAVSLHDCYARHWLAGYRELLGALVGRGTFLTLDEVASRVFRTQSI